MTELLASGVPPANLRRMSKTMTGGCQCGRVRYRVVLENDEAYLCHCRMCQRATGGVAAAFVSVAGEALNWEREADWYASSEIAQRPFCSVCGTPLGFRYNSGANCDLTVGSFDDPSAFVPVAHFGAESLHEAWLDTTRLPRKRSDETESVVGQWASVGKRVT